MSKSLALLCAIMLCACSVDESRMQSRTGDLPATTSANAPQSVISEARFDGYGATRFGMEEQAFRTAWNGELDGSPASVGGTCHYLWPSAVEVPANFAFMFEHGHFVRYDIGTAAHIAPGGGRVGMHAEEIRSRYPGLTETSHKYVEGGHYFRIDDPSDRNSALVFELDAEGIVTSWRIGAPPQVDYVEGCS